MKTYLSPSSFNRFARCSAAQLAVERGEWMPEVTPAMKIGSYVDSYFSGSLEDFKNENPDIFTKQGKLRSDFVKAEEIISIIKGDEILLSYVNSGKLQYKAAGKISGIDFVGYIDNYVPDKAIVDLKVVKSVHDRIWSDVLRKKITWIENYRYIHQLAIYRELIRQESGQTLPCFIAAVDKQKHPDREVIHIPDPDLNEALAEVKSRASEFMKIRAGELPALRCDGCDYCRATKKIENPISIDEL